MKENKDTACEPCEQNFERNINRLVKEGKALELILSENIIELQFTDNQILINI